MDRNNIRIQLESNDPNDVRREFLINWTRRRATPEDVAVTVDRRFRPRTVINRPPHYRDSLLAQSLMHQRFRCLYLRQYMRQEALRTYMTRNAPRRRNQNPSQRSDMNVGVEVGELAAGPATITLELTGQLNGLEDTVLAGITFSVPLVRLSYEPAIEALQTFQNSTEGLSHVEISMYTINFTKDTDGDEKCVICIQAIEREEHCRRLPCEHIFHTACIDRWLKMKSTCPNCRLNVRPSE